MEGAYLRFLMNWTIQKGFPDRLGKKKSGD